MGIFGKNYITKEDNLEESTIKMKKKFKSMNGWIVLLLGIYIAAFIVSLISNINFINTYDNMKSFEEEQPEDIVWTINYDLLRELVDFEKDIEGSFLDTNNYFRKVLIICTIVSALSELVNIVILVLFGNIFKNIEKTGVPFSNENSKTLTSLMILCSIMFIFGSCSLFTLVIIESLLFVFKYGCKIQNEVDELV